MLPEKNGKVSNSKITKPINIQYFFVTDIIKKKEVLVDWCPNNDMTGDFFTNPNKGALYRKFRDMIMGVVEQLDPGHRKYKTSKKKVVYTRNSKSVSKPRKKHGHRSVLEQMTP